MKFKRYANTLQLSITLHSVWQNIILWYATEMKVKVKCYGNELCSTLNFLLTEKKNIYTLKYWSPKNRIQFCLRKTGKLTLTTRDLRISKCYICMQQIWKIWNTHNIVANQLKCYSYITFETDLKKKKLYNTDIELIKYCLFYRINSASDHI